MYFYYGDRHYFLTKIILNDKELEETMFSSGLVGDYELFSYTIADKFITNKNKTGDFFETFVKNNSLSAIEYYNSEYNKYNQNTSYYSSLLSEIQSAIDSVYGKTYVWYQKKNKNLYVSILKTILYGSIRHFFFENRDKYLPQYDWYLVNSNPKRKDIMDMLFREFDKLAEIAASFKYYQDPDDIPLEFLIYLQEITGLTMNTYGGVFTDKQLRSLTKHLVEVWREKGSMFSIELFFACMGIQCEASELWFDKRLYYNSKSFNDYTKVHSPRSFGYYLTPKKPHTISYEFSPIAVSYDMYTEPKSSRIWEYKVDRSIGNEEVEKLLGIVESDEETKYTYFKSNFILINFYQLIEDRTVTKEELNVYKELISYMLPVFARIYLGNEYESAYGNDDWDIFNGKDNANEVFDNIAKKNRPATPLGLTDTEVIYDNGKYLTDAYPPAVAGKGFVSGSYIVIKDTRLTQYITNNGFELELPSGNTIPIGISFYGNFHQYRTIAGNRVKIFGGDDESYPITKVENNVCKVDLGDKFDYVIPVYTDTIDELVSSPHYDVIGSGKFNTTDYYSFYDGDHNYKYGLTNGQIDRTKLIRDDGTEGTLGIIISDDASDLGLNGAPAHFLTRYYFKVNGSEDVRIYPHMFAENDGSFMVVTQGYYGDDFQDEVFVSTLEGQVDWTYDIESTQEIESLPFETFDQKYTEKALNLFETSSYYDEAFAVNDLYNDNDTWNGHIQYEYCEYTNPLEYIESNLDNDITITLI